MLAQEEARLLGHSFIGTEHILLGLLHQDGTAAEVLIALGTSLSTVRERVSETIGLAGGPGTGSPPFTPRSKKVLELALRETLQLGHSYIGTEHILLGLIREGEGVACQVLVSQGINLAEVRQHVMRQPVVVELPHLPAAARRGGQSARSTDDPTLQASASGGSVTQSREVVCSFCGVSPPESGQLVSGNNAFICENCVRRWSMQLGPRTTSVRSTWASRPSAESVSQGEQPADPDSARTEITAVFTNYGEVSEDGRAAVGIENGSDLGWALKAVKANRQSYLDAEVEFTVDEIVFVDPEHAAVWYSISVNGSRVLDRHRGDAVVVDGEWNMARTTFSQLLAMGGVTLPPD